MALKELVKSVGSVKPPAMKNVEEKVQQFIAQGGTTVDEKISAQEMKDHRLTLRIPQWLMNKVDEKRKERIGSISRNLWILELIEKACKK
jgi:hypothetical protein